MTGVCSYTGVMRGMRLHGIGIPNGSTLRVDRIYIVARCLWDQRVYVSFCLLDNDYFSQL